MSNSFPLRRADEAKQVTSGDYPLRFNDVPIPLGRLSRQAVKDLQAYQLLLEEYRRFVVTLRHYAVELDKLRDVDAYCEADRLAVRMRIAESEHQRLAVHEQAEVDRLKRQLELAKLHREI